MVGSSAYGKSHAQTPLPVALMTHLRLEASKRGSARFVSVAIDGPQTVDVTASLPGQTAVSHRDPTNAGLGQAQVVPRGSCGGTQVVSAHGWLAFAVRQGPMQTHSPARAEEEGTRHEPAGPQSTGQGASIDRNTTISSSRAKIPEGRARSRIVARSVRLNWPEAAGTPDKVPFSEAVRPRRLIAVVGDHWKL